MIKIFLEFDRIDFCGAPSTHFDLTYKWTSAMSADTSADTPVTEVGTCIATCEVNAPAAAVHQMVYEAVLDLCSERGWQVPAKQDIFAFIPMDFQTLIGP